MVLFTETGMGMGGCLQVDCLVLGALVIATGRVCLRLLLGASMLWVQMQVIWIAIWIWTGDAVEAVAVLP